MRKGGQKRSEPTSSSDESPPKAQGQSPDKGTIPDLKPLEHSPSTLEKIALHHTKTRSTVISNMSNEQIAEVGFRIYQKWIKLRESYRKKSGTPAKKPKLATYEDPKDRPLPKKQGYKPLLEEHEAKSSLKKPKDRPLPKKQGYKPLVEEHEDKPLLEKHEDKPSPEEAEDKPLPEEHEDKLLPEDETDMMSLVHEEVKSLDSARFHSEIESVESFSSTDSEDDPNARLRQDGWERYLLRKHATKRHAALEMMVITVRDSAHMMDRLTASLSEMRLKIEPSSPDHSPEELDTFFNDLERTKERLIGEGGRRSHKFSDEPGSSKDKKLERKPDNHSSDDDEMGTRV